MQSTALLSLVLVSFYTHLGLGAHFLPSVEGAAYLKALAILIQIAELFNRMEEGKKKRIECQMVLKLFYLQSKSC